MFCPSWRWVTIKLQRVNLNRKRLFLPSAHDTSYVGTLSKISTVEDGGLLPLCLMTSLIKGEKRFARSRTHYTHFLPNQLLFLMSSLLSLQHRYNNTTGLHNPIMHLPRPNLTLVF